MRTTLIVACTCGHTGSIRLSENDQPYSKPWEIYEPINLDGKSFSSDKNLDIKVVLEKMELICPKCKRSVSPENIN